jgi:hypothetical protein
MNPRSQEKAEGFATSVHRGVASWKNFVPVPKNTMNKVGAVVVILSVFGQSPVVGAHATLVKSNKVSEDNCADMAQQLQWVDDTDALKFFTGLKTLISQCPKDGYERLETALGEKGLQTKVRNWALCTASEMKEIVKLSHEWTYLRALLLEDSNGAEIPAGIVSENAVDTEKFQNSAQTQTNHDQENLEKATAEMVKAFEKMGREYADAKKKAADVSGTIQFLQYTEVEDVPITQEEVAAIPQDDVVSALLELESVQAQEHLEDYALRGLL